MFSLDSKEPITEEMLESSGMYREETDDLEEGLESWRYRGTRIIYDPEREEAVGFQTYNSRMQWI